MEIKDGRLAVHVKTRAAWRKWLTKNYAVEKSVWLILHHKNNSKPCVGRIEATEEALCFGWIDSLCKKRDKSSYYLTFSPRNAKRSNWSKFNIERAERMITAGRMTQHGQALIDIAKQKGKWELV